MTGAATHQLAAGTHCLRRSRELIGLLICVAFFCLFHHELFSILLYRCTWQRSIGPARLHANVRIHVSQVAISLEALLWHEIRLAVCSFFSTCTWCCIGSLFCFAFLVLTAAAACWQSKGFVQKKRKLLKKKKGGGGVDEGKEDAKNSNTWSLA